MAKEEKVVWGSDRLREVAYENRDMPLQRSSTTPGRITNSPSCHTVSGTSIDCTVVGEMVT